MMKIKLDNKLYQKLQEIADFKGFSSVQEYIFYLLEKEIEVYSQDNSDYNEALKRISGLGYM